MKLPVDTSAIAFLCAVEAEPVVDFETKRPRADENGEPLYLVQLIALTDGAAEILAVKVPGLPSAGIRQGHPVKVTGLVAQPWTMNDRSGVAFRAARIDRPFPRRRPRRADQRGGGAQATVREGAGAAAKRAAGPLHPPDRVFQHPALASGVSPVMHPDRMPSLSVSIIVPAGANYHDRYHWRTDTGALRASIQFRAGGYSYAAIQGPPAALRELATALVEAADQAEEEAVKAEPVVGVAS